MNSPELSNRAILQNFANWWTEYTTDEHYTGNSYCLKEMQSKTDECLDQIKALFPGIEEAVKAERERIGTRILEGLKLLPKLSDSAAEVNNLNGYISGVIEALKKES